MKRVCICMALLAVLFTARAQSKASIGIKAGANFSTWTGAPILDVQFRNSFHAGILANLPLNKNLSLQPEMIYADEGTKIPDGKVLMSYVKVPLLVRYQHVTGFHIEAGPQLGVRVRAKSKMKDNPEEDAANQIYPVETSLAAGFGFQWSPNWDVSLRYNAGLSVIGYSENKIRSCAIAVGLAYMFRR